MTADFRFNESDHTYWLGGERLPGVTEILASCGMIDGQYFTEEATARGQAIHRAIHYWLEGDLDEEGLDPRIRPYLVQFQEFVRETGFKAHSIEQPRFHSKLKFAGTPDITGKMSLAPQYEVLIDIKTGGQAPWHALQLAAYKMLLQDTESPSPVKTYVLYLNENYYRLVQLGDRNAGQVFLSCLTVYHWKRRNGK